MTASRRGGHSVGKSTVGRRRVLAVIAAAAGLPWLPQTGQGARRAVAPYRWRGQALGAEAQLLLTHPDETVVRRALTRCLAEVARLERVFSLFLSDSELLRLNRDGRLPAASHDLRAVLAEAGQLGALSDGAFDVTVQPLWRVYAEWAAAGRRPANGPDPRELERARALVDHRGVMVDGAGVRFARPGMAATLNGIAQGYITDRVADLLRAEGFQHVLIQLGETYALGKAAAGRPWRVAVPAPGRTSSAGVFELADRAVAVSAGAATPFEPTGRHHHLLDPRTGESGRRYRSVSIVARRAVVADGLSTALYLLPAERAPALLAAAGAERALLVTADGRRLRVAAGGAVKPG